jgi:hypothetical protein
MPHWMAYALLGVVVAAAVVFVASGNGTLAFIALVVVAVVWVVTMRRLAK